MVLNELHFDFIGHGFGAVEGGRNQAGSGLDNGDNLMALIECR